MAKGKRYNSRKEPRKKGSNNDEREKKRKGKKNNSAPKNLSAISEEKKEFSVKKKLIPLKKLNINPKKAIDKMDINEIKEFASQFDLNPIINNKLLNYLKNNSKDDYIIFIKKYKYTLDFKDALKLDCFKKEEIDFIKKEFSENVKKFKLNVYDKDINSLSKLKLFNMFFFLLKEKCIDNFESIYTKIISYSIPISLIFKVPNRFGNIELNLYTYLSVFINFFTAEIRKYKDQTSKKEENQDNDISYEEIYFNWDNSIKGEEKKIDLTEFNQRKKRFEEYINNNYIEEKESSKSKNINKSLIKGRDLFIKMKEKIFRFKLFKEEIIEMFNVPDDKILEKIKFIYYCLLFPSKGLVDILSLYSKCLREKPYSQEEIASKDTFISYCNAIDQNCKNNNYKLFTIENLDNNFDSTINNPFNYNSKYYKFPILLKKNILDNDQEIKEAFINYLKYIYSSNIIKDIFYLCPEFNDFIYPLEDDEIFNELIEYTIFIPLEGDDLHGYTQKEIPEVLISVKLDENFPQEVDISKIVCELSQILNTCIHEQFKHYIKSLIFYNSFRFNLKKRIDSDLYNYGNEERYIKGILSITKNKNKYYEIDGGHKAEIYLYGSILNQIYFPQALELFKKSNWNKEIHDHIISFNNVNKKSKDQYQYFSLKQIEFNNDLCEFFRIFIKKFINIVGEEKYGIVFDNNASASRKSNNNIDIGTKNQIKFDYYCYINIKRNYINDASL